MAKIEEVKLVDDLDGGQADETVRFTWDGKPREIDLSAEHAARFREALAPYVEASRRVVGPAPAKRSAGSGSRASSADREHNRAVREWAQHNGFEVGDRGRIPADVLDAYSRRAA
ncbi:Lsr2 family protein [Pseudonocardia sp. McavD-2-B]|uniref:histone-like nucleoid-structuring protein Lsr2 n=1 Tax=Pseudonocardia sp. McavD-2-B TaxID=2954499 RepID=UPI0020977146|nr:Lsr2 family protein [Pseudonocardia sp. McavD-2-B]MCO7195392.1 Lsr2 family protein [Pseudonocardia sp. McavD-2-B]